MKVIGGGLLALLVIYLGIRFIPTIQTVATNTAGNSTVSAVSGWAAVANFFPIAMLLGVVVFAVMLFRKFGGGSSV